MGHGGGGSEGRAAAVPAPLNPKLASRPLLGPSGPASSSTDGSSAKMEAYSKQGSTQPSAKETQFVYDRSSAGVGNEGGPLDRDTCSDAFIAAAARESEMAERRAHGSGMTEMVEHDYGYEGTAEVRRGSVSRVVHPGFATPS